MGFRLARATNDATSVLYNLIEWSITLQRPFFLCFVDLKKAYDSVNKEALWFAITQHGIPSKLVGLLADLHRGTHATIKAFGAESIVFDIHGGVRQCYNITPTFFNFYLDFVTKWASVALSAKVGVKVAFMTRSKAPR
jgi:hypothetical protein